MNKNPLRALEHAPMSVLQICTVAICIALNALDGFDVLTISFAAPGIAEEWGIGRGELGIVLAMELIGMTVGSITLGRAADRFGRRPIILTCLLLMTLGMACAALVGSVNELLLSRFVTGLGIGGMLATTNAMVAEFANQRRRSLCVIMMATGYPVGVILGGSVASSLLELYSWRSVFVFGGGVTGAFLVIAWLWLPESAEYLFNRQPANALARINRLYARMGHAPVQQLEEPTRQENNAGFADLFAPALRAPTLLLILAYFAQIMTFYYILKWIPKIVVDMGFHPSAAGQVLVWANVGGAIGAVLLGLLTSRLPLRKLLVGVLAGAFVMVSIFGQGQGSLSSLALVCAVTGFFTNAGVVGLYALMAQTFPARLRASGTGLVIGIGRGGAALGPVVAGFLFASGADLASVSIYMASGALVAACAIFLLGRAHNDAAPSAAQATSQP
ncbi:MFS transporter [Marinobacter sp. NFXS9]|uniref:MFS transporter n=1 Tax=Marinobacter sp. NFXS9 TaxID=2818433 RepID=UPI0032E01A39